MTTIHPVNNKVILEFVEERDISERDSGLMVIQRGHAAKLPTSIVVSVPDVIRDERGRVYPSEFKVGDRVVFNQNGVQIVELGLENRVLVCDYKDIFGVVAA